MGLRPIAHMWYLGLQRSALHGGGSFLGILTHIYASFFIDLEFHYFERNFVGTIRLKILFSDCTTLLLQTVIILKTLSFNFFFF